MADKTTTTTTISEMNLLADFTHLKERRGGKKVVLFLDELIDYLPAGIGPLTRSAFTAADTRR